MLPFGTFVHIEQKSILGTRRQQHMLVLEVECTPFGPSMWLLTYSYTIMVYEITKKIFVANKITLATSFFQGHTSITKDSRPMNQLAYAM